ncbi:MAG: hypothetical protein HY321_15285 [Armatimonadetes bacterium]|nr:hypothetical protein [Armatimonadota bacterium]
MPFLSRAYIVVLVAGMLASAAIAVSRVRVERGNPAVQMVVEWNEIRALAFATSTSPETFDPVGVLRRLKAHGLTGLAVSQVQLDDLYGAGRAFLERDPEAPPGSPAMRLLAPDATWAAQIAAQVNARRGAGRVVALPGAGGRVVRLRDGFEPLRTTEVGPAPEAVRAAKEAGLEVVARVSSYPGVTPAAIRWIMADLKGHGARSVVFTGTEVLGHKDLLEKTADALLSQGLNYGFVEFGKQQGDAALARLLHGHIVRVHSITDAEMAQVAPAQAVERFVKAARERNIRIAYVRLFTQMREDPVGTNERYLDAIVRGLRRAGLTTGVARPYAPLYAGRPLLILAGTGVVAGVLLLIGRLVTLPVGVQTAIFLLGAFGSALLLGLPPTVDLARKALALLAALVFPTLAVLVFGVARGSTSPTSRPTEDDDEHEQTRPPHSHTLPVLARFAAMSAVTLAGALLIVGLLGDSRFLIKYDQFIGIKAAHVLPLLGLALALATGFFEPPAPRAARWTEARARARRLLGDPVFVWQVAAVFAGVVLLAMLVMRSGNESGVGVPGWELRFRSLLDRILLVRPRTKEFLVGHPAMVLALWAGLRGRRSLWGGALLVGAIGQVSLLNTFCHVHTPLLVSLLRAANGLVLGALLGIAAIWGIHRFGGDPRGDVSDPGEMKR